MDPVAAISERAPEDFRAYLEYVARLRLDPRLQSKLDAADLVQQTLLEAYQDRDAFRGRTDAARRAWLRRILLHNLASAVRDLARHKRDFQRERSLEQLLEDSSQRLAALLAVEDDSPGVQASQREDVLRLEEALATLPEEQRQAVVLRHLHSWPLADISRHLGRSAAAVAGLLHRALTRLHHLLGE
jgi:RNA polymerase sigma-70 factor (ECF subfamily)